MTNELYRIKIDYIVVGFLNFLIIQLKQNQVNLIVLFESLQCDLHFKPN